MAETLKADYLFVGAGAVGLAFADTLLSDGDATMIIVDRHSKPGGHWNIAYPFVKLHQPSAFYGVPSRELSKPGLESEGLNQGLAHLATLPEITAYYDGLMEERFLPSGRVQYFPQSDFVGDFDGELRFRSLVDGIETVVEADRVVDATYLQNTVPANHTPSFEIAEDVDFVPVNDLASRSEFPDDIVVVGGGKTGMDACLYLLERGVDPDHIRWIMPRDGWLIDRQNTQPGEAFFSSTIGAQAAQMEAIAQAQSIPDLFDRLERSGVLLRLDPDVTPKMFHGATISQAELTELRRINNVIRMGRVKALITDEIVLEDGTVPATPNTLHVDCSASAIMNLATKPIFQGRLITPQTVRSYQPVFSASVVAHVEATRETDAEKNQLCGVVPLPNHDTDWVRIMVPFMMNQYQWSRDPELRSWLENNRLDGFAKMVRGIPESDTEKRAIIQRMRDNSMPAMMKLQQFVAELS
ncbi:MAG: NAD(P)/FAD-dependent oxidoreductase [Pseudomonadota bacterium]